MNFLTKKHISRRAMLRGAGAALALPLLDSMIPAGVARAAAASPRMRLACVYVPHGAVMSKWTPAQAGTGFEFPEILKPFEPFRDRVNVISGLTLPFAYGQDASAGANHTRSSAVYLTGAKPGTGSEAELGISVDQVAAKHIGQGTPLPSLELSIEDGGLSCGSGLSCAYRNTISWQSPKSPLPMENNPQVIFERLFGDGSTAEERAARRAEARSLLDSVMGEIDSLQKKLPGGRSRATRSLSHRRARSRTAHHARGSAGSAGPEAARRAHRHSRRLRRSREAAVRHAGARLAGRRHARHDDDVREGGQQRGVSRRAAFAIRSTTCRITRTSPTTSPSSCSSISTTRRRSRTCCRS